MCWHYSKSTKNDKQTCSEIIILFICISIFHLLQTGLGNKYPTNLEGMILLQKRLVRGVTCSHYRVNTEPLLLVNRLLSIHDINLYVVGIFMYNYVTQKLPQIFETYSANLKSSKLFPTKYRCPWPKYSPSKWCLCAIQSTSHRENLSLVMQASPAEYNFLG